MKLRMALQRCPAIYIFLQPFYLLRLAMILVTQLAIGGHNQALAQQAITTTTTSLITTAAGSSYTTTGAAGSGLSGNTYQYRYGSASGLPHNKVFLSSFAAGGVTYAFRYNSNIQVVLRRVDNSLVTGNRDLIFSEGVLNTAPNPDQFNINAPYNPSMSQLFAGNDDLRSGTDNLFANQGDGAGNYNNVERLDVLINGTSGYLVSDGIQEGFAVFERGNAGAHDHFVVSVITAVDGSGVPTAFSGLVRVTSTHYGATNPLANSSYVVLRRDGTATDLKASVTLSDQGIGGVFFRFSDFGLAPGTKVYGYALAAPDFPAGATASNLLNVNNSTYFPTNTQAATTSGGLDFSAITGIFREFDDDNDGIDNNNDIDDDNDGITDLVESGGFDAFADADADGVQNAFDQTPGTGLPAFTDRNGDGLNDSYDFDLDGNANQVDLDSDNDGIPDLVEAGGVDTNGDGVVDVLTDNDGDGLANAYDASTGGVTIANLDTDGDGQPNYKDLDSDNDGSSDLLEAGGSNTNGTGIYPNLTDADGDGFADMVDGDVGNNGFAENTGGALIPTSSDANGDGRPDTYTKANFDGTGMPNPYDLDADGDGITDLIEAGLGSKDSDNNGVLTGADAGWADTNANGWADAAEGTVPPNSDNIGLPNLLDIDADNDGITDNVEGQATAAYQPPLNSDLDGDGIDDRYDNADNMFGGTTGNGIQPVNTDSDSLPDYLDTDTDNDGMDDIIEGNDFNGNGRADEDLSLLGDTDGDGLDDRFEAAANNGSGVTIKGFSGAGAAGISPAQQTPPNSTDRDWRSSMYLFGATILPVHFVSVNAVKQGPMVKVAWEVAREEDVLRYEIERSADGLHFQAIGSVNAGPVNDGVTQYHFNDPHPVSGKNFYRIREIATLDRYSYSAVATVDIAAQKERMLLWPNPVQESSQLQIYTNKKENAVLQVVDRKGATMLLQPLSLQAGNNVMPFVVHFSSGQYYLVVKTQAGKFSLPFMVP